MTEYGKEIAVGSVVAIVAVAILAAAVIYGPLGLGTSSKVGSTTTSQSISLLTTTSQSSSSSGFGIPTNFVFGSLPYLTVTPANSTFSIPLHVGAHIPASISYNSTGSYAVSFSNGTEWVYSQTCYAGINGTSAGGWPSGSDICSFAADNYLPENGQIVNSSVNLISSGTLGAVSPASVPADFSGNVTLTLHVGLPPGVYSLYLVIDVVTNGVGSGPWNLSPLPLVVLKN
jgi:hypothetical protein